MSSYRLRWRRKRLLARALWRRRELRSVANRTAGLRSDAILLFCTLRNERVRLPYFLRYYRDLGVDHFLFVDNDSDDGSREYLAQQPDVSLWTTQLQEQPFSAWTGSCRTPDAGTGVTVDVDEFLIYPFCETRPLRALTDWLDASAIRTFSAMLLDMYPKGPMQDQPTAKARTRSRSRSGSTAATHDQPHWGLGNLWIQGGPRTRTFFAEDPKRSPALNKIPLVRWDRSYAYVSSTHMLLPRGLNLVFDEWGGEKASGCLLHAKFLDTFAAKAAEEMARGQHYAESREYRAYLEGLKEQPDFWCKWSEKYINWRQLEILGLMSKGNWA